MSFFNYGLVIGQLTCTHGYERLLAKLIITIES